jgi:hypothetical protein
VDQETNIKGILDKAEQIVTKLSKAPQISKRLYDAVIEMTNYVRDLKILIRQIHNGAWEYGFFLIGHDCSRDACLETLNSRTLVGYVSRECLKTKPMYECVKEVLSELSFDYVAEQLLEGFVEALDDYIAALNDILGSEYDP